MYRHIIFDTKYSINHMKRILSIAFDSDLVYTELDPIAVTNYNLENVKGRFCRTAQRKITSRRNVFRECYPYGRVCTRARGFLDARGIVLDVSMTPEAWFTLEIPFRVEKSIPRDLAFFRGYSALYPEAVRR